jgi:alkylation response protein AidB-like acyl-CoA dehydrogenase
MKLFDDPGLVDLREEARTWLHENVPSEARPTGRASRDFDVAWQRCQYDGGWAGIDWETEYGGRGLSPIQQVIWYEELVRAKAPGHGCFGVAFGHAGPTLIARGTPDQRQQYLPSILRGETPWCQCFSEPGAGSDLASVRTRAELDGDELVITGSKIWSTYADLCDFAELLVLSDPTAARHKGLTWVVLDMRLPGVEVRPIKAIDGYPHNCEVFLDDVRVPVSHIVGGIGNGWSVAMSTLAAERGPGFLDMRLQEIAFVDDLIAYARSTGKIKDEALHDRLAEARALAAAVRSMAYYQVSNMVPGQSPGAETTAVRTFHVQLEVLVGRLAIDLLGAQAMEWTPWGRDWLRRFSAPIAGGTIDIQRNILGERVLGLPR